MMGEGGPQSPDSPGGGADTSEQEEKGAKESEEGAAVNEGEGSGSESGLDDSVRRRPPLKRQITRNQSDPKILPV